MNSTAWVKMNAFFVLPARKRRYLVSMSGMANADIRPDVLTALNSKVPEAPDYVEKMLRAACPGILPEGALLEAIVFDFNAYALSLHYSHPSFDVVPDGQQAPVFHVDSWAPLKGTAEARP